MSPKTYLVTGAAGFIGSAIAARLLGEGHRVWTVDNLSTGRVENLPAGIHFIRGGCQDPASIEQLQGVRFDAILHIAGQSSGEISFDDPVYDLRTNTESALRLIDYALASGCRRFIYASSMSVYGAVADEPIAESHPAVPLSFYGVGKLASEHYMRIYQTRGLVPTALRFFNVYGPHQNLDNLRQGMVSIYLAQMLYKDEVVVMGDGDRFRDFIYIDDVVDFACRAIDDARAYGQIFNVGTGVRTTVATLLSKLQEIGDLRTPVVFRGGTPGDQRGIYADVRHAEATLGFRSQTGLDTGLREMIRWAREAAARSGAVGQG